MSVAFYGDYDTTETVIIPFNTFSSDDPSASVTITNLVAGDIEIHKDGGTTQRASDSGVSVTIDFDSITGNHIASIDLSDNSDAGFYANGSRYQVRMEGTTVDGATINAWIGAFSIGCTLRPTTAGRTLDVEAGGCAGIDWANVANPTTAVDLSATDIKSTSEVLLEGTASAGSATTITLTGGVATAGYYDGCLVVITSGTGAGQARTILSYAASTVATVTRNFAVAPSNDSVFAVYGGDIATLLEAGTAQAGTITSITLDAGASATDHIYRQNYVVITGGTGIGQTRLISSYNGTTKVAAVIPAFTTTPDNTSVYQITPGGRVDVGMIKGVEAASSVSGLVDVNVTYWEDDAIPATSGGVPNVNVSQISGDSTAADNAELAFDGTGYGFTGCTIPIVTTLTGHTAQTGDSFARLGAPAGASIAADIAENQVDLNTIIADTNELQTDWTDGGRLDLLIDAIKAKTDNQPAGIPKNVALSNFEFLMVDSTDHITPKTGLTVAGTISKDGGAFGALTNGVAEIANGVYKVDITQAEMNADVITLKFTGTGADQRTITIKTST